MESTAFENLKQRTKATTPETKAVGAFDVLKQRQQLTGVAPVEEKPKEKLAVSFVKGLVSAPATLLARPFQAAAALGGADIDKIDEFSQKYSGGIVVPTPKKISDNIKDVGRGLETVALGIGGGGVKNVVQQGLKGFTKQAVKQGAKEGAIAGGIGGFGSGLEQGKGLVESAGSGVAGAAFGGVTGGALGGATGAIKNRLAPTPEVLTSKLDDSIKSIFKGTVADVNKVNESAFKAKKGLELLSKESPNIQIPDSTAPLGSNMTKPFNISKSSPNELLSGVMEMDKKIATNARKAVEEAKKVGRLVDTTEAELLINRAVQTGEIPKATGTRMLLQIKEAGNDPVKIHDWVQSINARYGKKYQRGTIDDTALGALADDVAEIFRGKLDEVVDRKGYAEAFSNNQELKRMLLAIAKKANKNVNFGDISTDAGLDLGISILTGNPAYMARTIGTGLFKGILSNVKNQSGIRSLRKAADLAGKLPSGINLPSSTVKSAPELLRLEAPKAGAPKVQNMIPLKTVPPTTYESRAANISRSDTKKSPPKDAIKKVRKDLYEKYITDQELPTILFGNTGKSKFTKTVKGLKVIK